MTTIAGPLVYKGAESSSHDLTFPSFNVGDMLIAIIQADVGSNSTIDGFTAVSNRDSTNYRTTTILAKIADESDTVTKTSTTSPNLRRITAHLYVISGVTVDLLEVESTSISSNGSENPNFNPPSLSPSLGLQDYVWFATAASNVDEGFNGGPSGYTSELSVNTEGDTPVMSFGTAYRVLEADTENPSAFTSEGSSSSLTFTVAIPVAPATTTPTLRKTGQQTFDKPAGIGTITGVTLNGEAITLDSQDAETFTVTDSDGSITTSGEYDLVATGDTVETITVQVNVVGVAPANNPLSKDGAALADLTDVEVRISAGATLAGTQLFYAGTATTDANGNLGNIDLSDTAADPNDVVLLKIRTADGDSIIAAETVELI